MTTRRLVIGLGGAGLAWTFAKPAAAIVSPRPGTRDPRIQTVDYDPEDVVLLRVALGFALTIEFSPDERIENVAVGNSGAWQVVVNHSANHLFVKPMQGSNVTNLSVVTDSRLYNFELTSAGAADDTAAFVLRFTYPATSTDRLTLEGAKARAKGWFQFTGSSLIRPLAMFDDGAMTYIAWRPEAPMPAIFILDAHDRETLINGAVRNGVYVIDQVAGKFLFRYADERATATRSVTGPVTGALQ